MKNILILGAGTAGTMMANHLRREVDATEWAITIVDENPTHYYQPGFLFIPFGLYSPQDVVKPRGRFLPRGVSYVEAKIDRIEAERKRVLLATGAALEYDILIIATGTKLAPEETEGMLGADWRRKVFDFYTLEGASALHDALSRWQGGRLVVQICEMPIKCPVAPLEFAFLADWWLASKGLRERTELVYATPLAEAFTKPMCSKVLGHLLGEKGIKLVTDFNIARVDNDAHKIVSWDNREVAYDLLVTIPPNMGDGVIARSGLGDESNFVPTDPNTLQSKRHEDIFVVGDATDVPTSKAGSVAHFECEALTMNILRRLRGEPLVKEFDGHANCFVESGYGKAFLIDFNYELQPVPGRFPLPVLGPFSLLEESRINHWGKLAFRWIYWNLLLKAVPMPGVGHKMSRVGKRIPPELQRPPAAK